MMYIVSLGCRDKYYESYAPRDKYALLVHGDIHIVTCISPFRIKAMHAVALWKEILIAKRLRISLEIYGHTRDTKLEKRDF